MELSYRLYGEDVEVKGKLNELLQISLAAARVNAELTQDDVARKMGISKQTIINWEKGRVIPKIPELEMLSRLYNISKDNIFLPEKLT